MPGFRKPTLVALALSLAAVGGYIGLRESGVDEPQPAAPQASAPESALADTLPAIVMDNLTGEPTSIASWPDKSLIVNFWATWCAPCLREIPMLKTFQASNPDVQVVGIAIDDADAVKKFAQDMQFNYPVLVGTDEGMTAATAFGADFVGALPYTVFTSSSGQILGTHTGPLVPEQLENLRAVLEDLGSGAADLATARARIAQRM